MRYQKLQMGQKNYSKWNQYDVLVDEKIMTSIKEFVPVDASGKSHSKSFRLTKNGQITGVFNAINMNENNQGNRNMEQIN